MAFASACRTVPVEFRSRWGWFVALGILMIVAGFIALLSVFLATVVSVLIVGMDDDPLRRPLRSSTASR